MEWVLEGVVFFLAALVILTGISLIKDGLKWLKERIDK